MDFHAELFVVFSSFTLLLLFMWIYSSQPFFFFFKAKLVSYIISMFLLAPSRWQSSRKFSLKGLQTDCKRNTNQRLWFSHVITQPTTQHLCRVHGFVWVGKVLRAGRSSWVWGIRLGNNCERVSRNCRIKANWILDAVGAGCEDHLETAVRPFPEEGNSWNNGQRMEMRGRRRRHRGKGHMSVNGWTACLYVFPPISFLLYRSDVCVCVLVCICVHVCICMDMCICVYVCTYVHVCSCVWAQAMACGEVRGTLTDVSLLPLCGFWISNSGLQAWGQEPSHAGVKIWNYLNAHTNTCMHIRVHKLPHTRTQFM